MNSGAPKENENPTIRSVERRGRTYGKRRPLDWNQFFGTPFDENTSQQQRQKLWTPTTPEDGAIFHALMDVSKATRGRGVALLNHVGLEIPTTSSNNNNQSKNPIFFQVEESHFSVKTAKKHGAPSIGSSEEKDECKEDASSHVPASVMTMPSTTTTVGQQQQHRDRMDAAEVFDIIRTIQDPEHPHTLEELGVVSLEQVEVVDEGYYSDTITSTTTDDTVTSHNTSTPAAGGAPFLKSTVQVRFTPTIPHCSMATLIGLCLRVKLFRSLPPRFKVSVQIEPGTHASENAINKQLRDKERICAALENKHLAGVVNKCIKNGANHHH